MAFSDMSFDKFFDYMLSKFIKKSTQKLLIFPNKTSFEKDLIYPRSQQNLAEKHPDYGVKTGS